jgi:hypothetical protein
VRRLRLQDRARTAVSPSFGFTLRIEHRPGPQTRASSRPACSMTMRRRRRRWPLRPRGREAQALANDGARRLSATFLHCLVASRLGVLRSRSAIYRD